MLNLEIHPLHTQALLKSLLASPLLVGDLASYQCFERNDLDSEVDLSAAHLNYAQKLGHVYEDALAYLLEGSDSVTDLHKNIQVFDDDRRTLGELDYIFKISGRWVHLELAVKFYLISRQGSEVTLPGPDPRDNYYNKVERLAEHQLKLSDSKFGKRLLEESFGIQEIEPTHLIYGKFFEHVDDQEQFLPQYSHPHSEKAKWIYLEELIHLVASGKHSKVLKMIPKHCWPLSIQQYDATFLDTLANVTIESLAVQVGEGGRCVMAWSSNYEKPLFVVPSHWPALA